MIQAIKNVVAVANSIILVFSPTIVKFNELWIMIRKDE